MTRLAITAVLAIAGLISAFSGRSAPAPTPAPPAGDIVLAGKFAGPTAAADAAVTAGMFSELSDELTYDSERAGGPHLTTGVAFDDLRTRAFDLRCRGQKIGDRQPRVRDAIKSYLEAKVGVSGGPVGPEQRTAWIAAMREIGRAAADAAN
jgi:hypothetical protein